MVTWRREVYFIPQCHSKLMASVPIRTWKIQLGTGGHLETSLQRAGLQLVTEEGWGTCLWLSKWLCCIWTHDFLAKNGAHLPVSLVLLHGNNSARSTNSFCDSTSILCLRCVLDWNEITKYLFFKLSWRGHFVNLSTKESVRPCEVGNTGLQVLSCPISALSPLLHILPLLSSPSESQPRFLDGSWLLLVYPLGVMLGLQTKLDFGRHIRARER